MKLRRTPEHLRHSLERRVLVPLILACGLISLFSIVAIDRHADEIVRDRLQAHGRSLVNAIQQHAETAHSSEDLNRFVTALGGEPGVTLIVIAAGGPARVIASTRQAWIGRDVEDLPGAGVADDLREAFEREEPAHHTHESTHESDYTSPIWLRLAEIDSERPSRGVVMVHLDNRSNREAAARISRSLVSQSLISIFALTIVTYFLLKRHVVGPILAISRGADRRGTNELARIVVPDTAELAYLATTLQRSFDSITQNAHQMQAALDELGFQKRTLDEHAIVSETDVKGTITYVNDRFCAISGYDRDELIGRNHRMLASGHHSREFWTEVFGTLLREGVWHGEVCNRRKDGTLYWVNSTIVGFRDAEGRIARYVSVRTDVTQMKSIEEQLRRSNLVAESASRAKGEFLATMSHEIRTPMNGVIGFIDLLFDTPCTPQQREYLEIIKNSGESLMTIINDILDFSKIEAGMLVFERLPVDVCQVVSEVTKLMRGKAVERGLYLRSRLADERVIVSADPTRVRQVLMNLVSNALKFTEKGGVEIAIGTFERDGASHARIEVVDTGIGISEDVRLRLFEKFVQADATTTRRFGGTGLGLAISRHIVVAMGGSIDVDSEEGQGSTFWFELPLSPIAALDVAGDSRHAEILSPDLIDRVRGRRVLLAEDNAVNQMLAVRMLQKLGLEVDVAADGRIAVEKARNADYDLIFMDCLMPEMDGFEATRAIRDFEASSDDLLSSRRTIIALTANVLTSDRQKCFDCGMDDFLPKPLRIEELRKMIERHLAVSVG